MSDLLNKICRKYEVDPRYKDDFSVGKKAEKARSGDSKDILRLVNHLQVKYSGQTEDIETLQEYLATDTVPKTAIVAKSEPTPEKEPIQEPSRVPNAMPMSELNATHNPMPEAAGKQIKSNDISSQERQYHAGMEYFINPDDKVEIHPAANTMPMMSRVESWGLVKDIKDNGQLMPILTKDGEVVDGRNRLNACRKLKIPAKAKEVPENIDVAKLVVTLNEQRRNLSTPQKAACAVLYMEETKVSGGRSREIVGKIFKVSGETVQKAKKIKKANEELFFKLHRDEISLATAMKEIRKDDHPKTENDSGYSDDEGCIELSKYFPKDKVDDLSDLADKCSGKLKVILKTLLKHISGEITVQKIAPMVLNNSSCTELEVTNECA